MNLRNYFEYKGKKYYTGTIFIMKVSKRLCEYTFVGYNVDYKALLCKSVNSQQVRSLIPIWESVLNKNLVSITDKIDTSVHSPAEKKMKDTQIDGLFLGWMWYIFLMIISVIFKDAIGLWILWSVVFFSWRKKKIKKEGTYIEW